MFQRNNFFVLLFHNFAAMINDLEGNLVVCKFVFIRAILRLTDELSAFLIENVNRVSFDGRNPLPVNVFERSLNFRYVYKSLFTVFKCTTTYRLLNNNSV